MQPTFFGNSEVYSHDCVGCIIGCGAACTLLVVAPPDCISACANKCADDPNCYPSDLTEEKLQEFKQKAKQIVEENQLTKEKNPSSTKRENK